MAHGPISYVIFDFRLEKNFKLYYYKNNLSVTTRSIKYSEIDCKITQISLIIELSSPTMAEQKLVQVPTYCNVFLLF